MKKATMLYWIFTGLFSFDTWLCYTRHGERWYCS